MDLKKTPPIPVTFAMTPPPALYTGSGDLLETRASQRGRAVDARPRARTASALVASAEVSSRPTRPDARREARLPGSDESVIVRAVVPDTHDGATRVHAQDIAQIAVEQDVERRERAV